MTSESMLDGLRRAPSQAETRVIKPLQLDGNTPQTRGMHRLAAVSNLLVGSEKLWAGVTMADPNTASSVHHHGPLETVVYVAEGRGKLRWGRRLEHETDLEAGDFLFVPAYVPHQEINPSADQPALWVVVRSGPEAIVVDLALSPDGECVAPESEATRRSATAAWTPGESRWRSAAGTQERGMENNQVDHHKPVSLTLLAVSWMALFGAVCGALWLWQAGQGWPSLLLAAIVALVGVFDIVWACHARSARRLAVLDAYAEREITRSSYRQDFRQHRDVGVAE
jgi:uncharacterized RmlC-like cupin family protein